LTHENCKGNAVSHSRVSAQILAGLPAREDKDDEANRFDPLYSSFIQLVAEQQPSLSTVEKTARPVSSLATQIERAGLILQNGAVEQIETYRSRFEALDGLYERLFKELIVSGLDNARAYDTAKKLFGNE